MAREFPEQPIVGVGAVVLRPSPEGPDVLLIRRANPPLQGEWSLPGGMVELGERLEAAIIREVLEETGLTVQPLAVAEVLDSIVLENGPAPGFDTTAPSGSGRVRFHYVLIDYVCRVESGTLACSSDAADACWLTVSQLRQDGPFALQSRTIAVIDKAAGMLSRDPPST